MFGYQIEADSLAHFEAITCIICGAAHLYEDCSYVKITKHVHDTEIPSRAKLSMPESLSLTLLSDGSYSVVGKTFIKKGTQFGPFVAEKLEKNNNQSTDSFSLTIFSDITQSKYDLNICDEDSCNWMMFVVAAVHLEEQNLICYQAEQHIYYTAIKDINVGAQLKVWYAPHYAHRMGKSVLLPNPVDDQFKNIDVDKLIREQQKIPERKFWTCKFCNHVEKTVVGFAQHVRRHYMSQMRKQCEICKKHFTWKRSLMRHLKIVHNASKFEFDLTEKAEASKQHEDIDIGGPLLNTIFTEYTDLQRTDLSRLDLSMDNSNLMLDNDNLNMENFLSVKDLDFNFEIDDNQNKQFVCDICCKEFLNLRCLILHLKHHTGEYTCFKCLKIFCRKENYMNHICNLQKQHSCQLCDRKFTQKKYLRRHIQNQHFEKHKCEKCLRIYASRKDLQEHNCRGVPNELKEKFNCPLCDKEFFRQAYLRKHLLNHAKKKNNKEKNSASICFKCGQLFADKNSLYMHNKKHALPSYSCDICDKKFFRKDTLDGHKYTHGSSSDFHCNICGKYLKTLKILRAHLATHNSPTTAQKFKCDKCGAEFKRVSNLNKHIRGLHDYQTSGKISIEFYTCPICFKKVKLRSSLSRHLKKIHPGDYINVKDIKPKVSIQSLGSTPKIQIHSVKKIIPIDNKTAESISESLETELDQQIDKLLNSSGRNVETLDEKTAVENLVLELDNQSCLPKETGEVCLSIPDLTENDQEIKLDKNAYILENGTIVQPQDTNKFVLYVLEEPFTT